MRSSAAMATRPNRLLLPAINASSSCKPLDACYPLPPLPTLLTPPPPPPQESSTSVRFRHSTLLPALPITAASLLAAAAIALLLGFFFLRRRRRSRAGAAPAAPDEGPGPFEGGGDGEVDHHVWYIRTTGLDESAIRAITAWAYKADDDVLGASAADCAVCLSEFHDGEQVRRLPKCGHAFHLSCIDTWLRSHVNCPLCRAPVVAPTSVTSGAGPGASTSSSSSFSSALASPDFILDHMEPNSVSSALLDQIDGQQSPTARAALEVETEGERLELGAGDPIVIDQIRNSELRVPSDIGEQGFQPIRRSFSMGSFTCELYIHRSKLEEGLDGNTNGPTLKEEWDNRTWRKKGNASCGTTSLRKETERSLSSSGERFFSARHRRAGSSVLPL